MVFNGAIDHIIQNNAKARQNPRGLSQLDGLRRILSIAIKMLKREMPGIRLIVSYADLNHGHSGKIYQASNWMFVGETGNEAGIMLNGKLTHRRTINSKYGTSDIGWLRKRVDPCACRHEGKPKFKYLFPLDGEIAERVRMLARAFPRACSPSETSDAPGVHPGEGRAARTVALQSGKALPLELAKWLKKGILFPDWRNR